MIFLSYCEPKNNYNVCKKIEEARCKHAYKCDNQFDLNGCLDYYLEECRHRVLPAGRNPKEEEVELCSNTILNQDCNKIIVPNDLKECYFLNPPADGGEDTQSLDFIEDHSVNGDDEEGER